MMSSKSLFVMVMVVVGAFASGCTMTMPEHGRPFSIGPAGNPNSHEMAPVPSGPGLSHDDHAPR
jgi:hypothetical protein